MSADELRRKVDELNDLIDRAGDLRAEIIDELAAEYSYDPGEDGEDYDFFEDSDPVYAIDMDKVQEYIAKQAEEERE